MIDAAADGRCCSLAVLAIATVLTVRRGFTRPHENKMRWMNVLPVPSPGPESPTSPGGRGKLTRAFIKLRIFYHSTKFVRAGYKWEGASFRTGIAIFRATV